MRSSSAGIDNETRAGEKQITNHSGACSGVSEKRNQSPSDACLRTNTNSTIVPFGIVCQIFAIGARITDEEQHNEARAKDEAPDVSKDEAFVEKQFGGGGDAEHPKPDDGVGEPKGQEKNDQSGDQSEG